ncbi:MAG: DUF3854 domain-containing protein [Oculatellaceae cyanobacterium bins.114]|nr:DUF3854 domain-containing protein [Oculatellaceae cyanobacterium bins.114]
MNAPFLEEFQKSAIPDHLSLINVRWIKGDEAIQILAEEAISKAQKVESFVTKSASKILNKYAFAAAGGWVAYGCDADGKLSGTVPLFKPLEPRKELENGRLKTIKYETPQGYQATPILPWVDELTAAAIYKWYGVTPLEGETFWQVVWRCGLPIAITEGLKKALSLIAHGLPAIALRGVACWHLKGSDKLHESISHFVTPVRSIYIVFDQDEKLRTQRDVRNQILKLGSSLEQKGCKVFAPTWDRKLGKGIDDVLWGLSNE